MTSLYYLNKIEKLGTPFLTTVMLRRLFPSLPRRTLEDLIARLVKSGFLQRVSRGKYLVLSKDANIFEIAYFLYNPSYISLETALNHYGILSQFPTLITSVTTRRSVLLNAESIGEFEYVHIPKRLLTGFTKEGRALFATPEKALFDYLYQIAVGRKTDNILDELNYSTINLAKLREYLPFVPTTKASTISKLIKKIETDYANKKEVIF